MRTLDRYIRYTRCAAQAVKSYSTVTAVTYAQAMELLDCQGPTLRLSKRC